MNAKKLKQNKIPTMKISGTRKFAADAEPGLRVAALRRLFAAAPVLLLICPFCIAISL